MEAASEEVVHAARGHRVERRAHHRERVLVAAEMHAEQELERRGLRELGRLPPPSPLQVELRPERASGLAEQALGERLAGGGELARAANRVDERRRLGGDVAALVAVGVRDRRQHLPEARQTVPRLGRVVRAAEERLALGGEEDRHRPAAVPGERDDRVHVERVDVGPLLAVDLDVDEALVHERRRLVVLERLVLHDVAPVAGGVADGEEHGLVLVARLREGVLAPGVPVHRVVSVLEEVRARFLREAVHETYVCLCVAHVRRNPTTSE